MANTEKTSDVNYKVIILGLLVFILMITFLDLKPGNFKVTLTASVAVLMAIWWVSEALPIGLTSLLPIVIFPVFGVLDGKAISNAYINYVIFLFIGGFFMALALEKWGLHKRIALKILSWLGGSPFKILLGFMFASAFLSMWMSNTATAMMMLPIIYSVTTALEESHGEQALGKFPTAVLLGVAYACSIGGIATLVGTPPNLSLVRIFEIIYPHAPEISFGQWLLFAFPLSVILFVAILFVLYFLFKPSQSISALEKSFFVEKYQALGPISAEQKRVFNVFLLLIFLWVFRSTLKLGSVSIPGWSSLLPNPAFINDGTVAIFITFLLFVIPTSDKSNNEGLLTWAIVPKIPWGIVLLFGGGFALAKAFIDSGLSNYVGEQLATAEQLSNTELLLTVTSLMTFLTEFTSNTATTEMMLPIVSSLTNQLQMNPLYLMIPVTLAASMAFMFPIATPPNAVVFATGKLQMKDMVKAGFIINLIAIAAIVIVAAYLSGVVFDIDPQQVPDWAKEVQKLK